MQTAHRTENIMIRYFVLTQKTGEILFAGSSIALTLEICRMFERNGIQTDIGYELQPEEAMV